MGVDPVRVGNVYAAGPSGQQTGSGYLIARGVILTAAHVVTGLVRGSAVDVLPYGGTDWLPARVAWVGREISSSVDAALLQLDKPGDWPEPLSVLRWGLLLGSEPVSASAIGYPWAQQRPDASRGTDHLVGFITPPPAADSGLFALHVLTSAPRDRLDGGSPWAGMSGAALIASAGTLVGLVVVDPARYGPDRLLALPVAGLVEMPGFCDELPARPEVVEVGADWRLSYGPSPEQSLRLRPPYRPLPIGYNLDADPYRLLDPQHKVVHVPGREPLVDELVSWAVDTSTPLAVKTISGSGGAGKTRVAAEVCLKIAGVGWDAGFADFTAPPGDQMRTALDRPTLIVVDDADLQSRRAGELARQTIYSPVPVRLLLVSRNRARWWNAFHRDSDNNANGFDHGDLILDDHLLGADARLHLYQEAYRRFRELRGAAQTQPTGVDLSAGEFAVPLLIQITALIAALDGVSVSPNQQAGGSVRERVLRAAVAREADRWVGSLHSEPLAAANERLLRRCVTTATLTSPNTDSEDAYELEQAAIALLRAVPDLKNTDDDRLITLAGWLHHLHRGPAYWNPLRPDPLCDQLLADLDILPHLSARLAEIAQQRGDSRTASRLLTELTRAATASGGAALQALSGVLAAHQSPA